MFTLPDSIFKPGDSFLLDCRDNADAAARNYGVYFDTVRQLGVRSIVEIGVRGGYSAYAMLSAGGVERYVGIDNDSYDETATVHASGMLRGAFPGVAMEIRHPVDSQYLTTLGERFDLASIDGDHTRTGALHDMTLCARWCRWLLVDDSGHIDDVKAAVDEFIRRHGVAAVFHDTWRGQALLDVAKLNEIGDLS